MKAMILAAGRGERMRPLTDATPKPLLKAGDKTLIEFSIENLVKAGFNDIVINIAHLGWQIKEYCGNGRRWGVSIRYSDEGEAALETAGGIAQALPLLGDKPFLVVNADIIYDFPLLTLREKPIKQAHLVLIDNPPHNPNGDFCLNKNGLLSEQGADMLTFSGIGVYDPALFVDLPPRPLKLRPVIELAISRQQVSGEKHTGLWLDIGTPERLKEISTTRY
jgi:MurNAc alpha-1-phosphate uridylyltransferase